MLEENLCSNQTRLEVLLLLCPIDVATATKQLPNPSPHDKLRCQVTHLPPVRNQFPTSPSTHQQELFELCFSQDFDL